MNGVYGQADLRWVPLQLPKQFARKPGVPSTTYIIIHHPEDVCKQIKTASTTIETEQFRGEWDLDKNLPPRERLSAEPCIFLTGGDGAWCKRLFAGRGKTLGLKSFFSVISKMNLREAPNAK